MQFSSSPAIAPWRRLHDSAVIQGGVLGQPVPSCSPPRFRPSPTLRGGGAGDGSGRVFTCECHVLPSAENKVGPPVLDSTVLRSHRPTGSLTL